MTSQRSDRALIAVAVLSSFVAFLDGSVVNLALPAIAREFASPGQAGLSLQQWGVDGYLLALGALILVAGSISDGFGRLSVLRMGLVVFGGSSLMCAVAPLGGLLISARCLQGVGAAFLVPSSLAMINARFAGAEQARAIGIWTADWNCVRGRPGARRRPGRPAQLALDLRGEHPGSVRRPTMPSPGYRV